MCNRQEPGFGRNGNDFAGVLVDIEYGRAGNLIYAGGDHKNPSF